uniref:Uncharacterized protein n=1 Tax=Romanomermis culicivorax TaxID=13658 RepID=A0A915IL85_ROMCU
MIDAAISWKFQIFNGQHRISNVESTVMIQIFGHLFVIEIPSYTLSVGETTQNLDFLTRV